MAPSSGLPKAIRIVKLAISQTTALIRSKLPQSTASGTTTANAVLQPVRIHSNNHPIHPLALLKQSRLQHRWFSTTIRNLSSKSTFNVRGRYDRSSFPVSKISKTIANRGVVPFASTLRPNLTGGALPRSAGGYCLGGGGIAGRSARHFSHTPGAQAQVVQNVSAGIRAFLVGGGKARFDGLDGKTGEKRFKVISKTEDEVLQKLDKPFKAPVKGTSLEFQLSPIITAFATKSSARSSITDFDFHLNSPDLLSNLSIDFARALKDFSAIVADLNRLSTLGNLPISLSPATLTAVPVLTCRFPGCDAHTVSRLCDELGIQRGVIREDEAWDRDHDVEMALLFPFASSNLEASGNGDDESNGFFAPRVSIAPAPEQLDWRPMMSPSRPTVSALEFTSDDDDDGRAFLADNKSLSHHDPDNSLSGYESLCDSDFDEHDPYVTGRVDADGTRASGGGIEGYEGMEGILRFLRECDESARG